VMIRNRGDFWVLWLGIILGAMVWLLPNKLREVVDLVYHYVGPTTLPLFSLMLLSAQEYLGRNQPEHSHSTAKLCPAVGTIGTLLSLSRGSDMDVTLISHAINSTLIGLGYYVLFCFLSRRESTKLELMTSQEPSNPESRSLPNIQSSDCYQKELQQLLRTLISALQTSPEYGPSRRTGK